MLNQVATTLNRLQTQVGHTGKTRRYTTSSAMVLRHLYDRGMTIDFKADSAEERDLGCKNIWQKIAYEMGLNAEGRIITRPTIIERCRSAQLHWQTIRSSVKYCRDQLSVDRHIALLIVPRWVGQKQIQVITTDPAYQVNEGETAKDIALQCGDKRLQQNIRKCMESYELMTGGRLDIAKKISQVVLEECENSLAQPMLSFPDDSEPTNG